MKISIVTINYNQGPFLERAIISVLEQNYDNLEYIIIDGGSTDNSLEVIKKYNNRITYWESEKDQGPSHALNKGFAKATGDLFFYLNADDVLGFNSLNRIKDYVERNPGYDIYYGHGYTKDISRQLRFPYYSDLWNLKYYKEKKIAIFQPSTFIKSTVFRKTNGFNENNSTCWDGELLVDMALIGAKFLRINDFFGTFYLHNESITGSNRLQQKYLKDFENIGQKINQQLPTGHSRARSLEILWWKIRNDLLTFLRKVLIKLMNRL
jgi:glycosyltransferase involved in cell wall biosynthesis